MRDYKLECSAAYNRLITIGVPATVEFGGVTGGASKNKMARVAETTQYFITAMDSLKLDMHAVDEIYPLMNDLLMGLNSVRLVVVCVCV